MSTLVSRKWVVSAAERGDAIVLVGTLGEHFSIVQDSDQILLSEPQVAALVGVLQEMLKEAHA